MRVGIVGAGITGLALTHYLAAQDVDVLTFEAAETPGGVIRSRRVDGHLLEYGPQRIRQTNEIGNLIDQLDLGDELLVADDALPLYVYAEGKLRTVPRSVRSYVRTDLLSLAGKCRVLAEPLTGRPREDERAGHLFERKFGSQAYERCIEPLFGGIYASNPAEMPVKYALSPFLDGPLNRRSLLGVVVRRLIRNGELPPSISFVGGLATLPKALYDQHRPYVHLDTPVGQISANEDGTYRVHAGQRSADVDIVLLTVRATAAGQLLADLNEADGDPLAKLTYNSLGIVHLKADVDREGLGYQVSQTASLRTRGVTWNASQFDREGVFTAFLGGMDDPAILEQSEQEIGQLAAREFESVMGTRAEVLDVTKLDRVIPAYDTSWAALEAVSLPAGIGLVGNYSGRIGVPSRIRQAKRMAGVIARASDAGEMDEQILQPLY